MCVRCVLYLWESHQSGATAGNLELHDFSIGEGQPAVLSGQLQPFSEGGILFVVPCGTKTTVGRGQVSTVFRKLPAASADRCFITQLGSYLAAAAASQHPVTKHLIRARAISGAGFKEGGLTFMYAISDLCHSPAKTCDTCSMPCDASKPVVCRCTASAAQA